MLHVRLIGDMVVTIDDVAITPPQSRRAWALLGWLALHPGTHPRGAVSALFWPGVLDSSARASLRSALWALRRALGPRADDYLCVGNDRLGLKSDAGLWVDMHVVDQLAEAGRTRDAVELGLNGEVLDGFEDEWVLDARESHRARMVGLLETLASRADDPATELAWTRRQASVDPFAEEPVRRLMTRLTRIGDLAAAIAAYERFHARLARELNTEPSPATRQLAQNLRAGTSVGGSAPPMQSAWALVGRERELWRLHEAWKIARSGTGVAVVISGEAGIGKTRLATELIVRAGAEHAVSASGTALDLGISTPLGLWAELIGDLTDSLEAPPPDVVWPSTLRALLPDLEQRLGRASSPAPPMAPDLERARLFEATVGLIEWASRRPLILLMEDVHAADSASLDLIGYVCRRVAHRPVLMVLTRRPLPRRVQVDVLEGSLRAAGRLAAELVLGPLPAAQIAVLANEVAPLDHDGVEKVIAAADGNALLAVEWAAALARGQDAPPESLRAAVRTSLARLGGDALRLAQLVAVAGRDLDRNEIEALPIESPDEAAASAAESGLLVAHRGRLGYRHALLRDAAYVDIADPVRMGMHETIGTMLSTREPRLAAEAARHFRQAGSSERAAAQLLRAARHARAVATFSAAAAALGEAIELAPGEPSALVELAEVQALLGDSVSSDATFARALAVLSDGDPEQLARAWLRNAAWHRGAVCNPRRVLQAARRSVEVLDAGGVRAPELRVEALAQWAWAEAVAGSPDVADTLLRRVHTVLDGRRPNDLLAHEIGHARAFALVRRGCFRESYAHQIAAGEASQRAGRPDLSYGSWSCAACAAACAGDFDRALEFVDRGLATIENSGLDALQVHLLAGQAHILARLGRRAEARAAAGAQRQIAERLDNAKLLATSEHDRGLLELALGDADIAVGLLKAALEHGAQVSRPLTRLALAEALTRLGRFDEAEVEIRRTTQEPLRPGDMPETLVPRLAWLQGIVARGRGDHVLERRRLSEAAAGWQRLIDRAAVGDQFVATLADFGRPPMVGLVEPVSELARVRDDLRAAELARD